MATDVKLPRLGQGMETGVIVRWLKAEGDSVRKSDPLYELDTDKVTQEVEAETDGVLLKILVREGEVGVGATVAVIGAGDEADGATSENAPTPTAVRPAEPVEAPAVELPPAGGTSVSSATSAASTPEGGRVKASPLARRIARERGVDLATITPTGPEGRITAEDVQRGPSAPIAPSGPTGVSAPAPVVRPVAVEIIPLTSVRKTIARRLTEAWSAPVFQLGVSVDMTEALALRESLVARLTEGDAKPTVNDVLVKLVAVGLMRHPAINATFGDDAIERHPSAHIGIAVAAPQGLIVPVIRNADRATVQEIARTRVDLVGRSRDNKLTLDDLGGGTFTISNLGMFGVEEFTAVLNPPQVAILAVGAARDQAVVVEGAIAIAPMLRLTLTCDHRAIDGADGATFLQTLVALVERPALAL